MERSALLVIGQLHKGGAERQLYLLTRGLVGKGWRVEVASLDQGGEWVQPLVEAGVGVHQFGSGHLRLPRRLAGLRALLRLTCPALVHSWMWHGNVYTGAALRLVPGSRHIACERVVDPTRKAWQAKMDLWAGARADWMVCNSRDGTRWLESCGWPAERLRVIHNGLEPFPDAGETARSLLRGAAGLPAQGPLVLGAGRLEPQKRFQDFVAVCARVAEARPDACFALAGAGSRQEELEREVERLGLAGRFRFLGVRADLHEWMRLASVVLHTSAYEGLSNVLLEATLLGRPVVATRATGNDEIVEHGAGGLLAPVGEVEALSSALLGILADPQSAESMGRHAAILSQSRFSTATMVEAWEGLYLETLDRKGK